MPPAATKSNHSDILTLPYPQGHVMSLKCEQPLDEVTVQVWLLYDHPNFKYCTLLINGTELWTDKQTDRQTDGWMTQTLDAPVDLSGWGHKNHTYRYQISDKIVEISLGRSK